METEEDFSIVAVDRFVQATRDSGYKGTASAISELVDNSLQAGATAIEIRLTLTSSEECPIQIAVIDNGRGMDPKTLRTALRFGGSTRFNDRSGLGRYGMGLPNSSFSQARRVQVFTWTGADGDVWASELSLTKIASGEVTEVPKPGLVDRPDFARHRTSGTAVVWTECDRLDVRRVSTLEKRLSAALGRRFRHFIFNGTSIEVNGAAVDGIDPLFLEQKAPFSGASEFEVFEREISVRGDDLAHTGKVRVIFSELPLTEWSRLSNQEKRDRGITKGAGVSIVRGGREVDHGWFFLGGKRRENYDDWWRCEVRFDPLLDEAFGITHSKQQIRPRADLVDALSGDMETIARALSARVRKSHVTLKLNDRFAAAEAHAADRDMRLRPLPALPRPRDEAVQAMISNNERTTDRSEPGRTKYKILTSASTDTVFFNHFRTPHGLSVVINPDHPFYRKLYQPLLESELPDHQALRGRIDLLLIAAARAEAALQEQNLIDAADNLRRVWSDTLATFLD